MLIFNHLINYSYLLQPLCFLCAWLLFALFISSIINSIIDITYRFQTMHQIPCYSCRYFTNNYHLKCTIHPSIANTESAINCFDFHQESNYGDLSQLR